VLDAEPPHYGEVGSVHNGEVRSAAPVGALARELLASDLSAAAYQMDVSTKRLMRIFAEACVRLR
jgi:hypothetical protein